MSKFWNAFIVCVILVGSFMNPLSNSNISKAMMSLKDDVVVTTVGHEMRSCTTNNELVAFDKGLYVYYKPLHVGYETPHITWERES